MKKKRLKIRKDETKRRESRRGFMGFLLAVSPFFIYTLFSLPIFHPNFIANWARGFFIFYYTYFFFFTTITSGASKRGK